MHKYINLLRVRVESLTTLPIGLSLFALYFGAIFAVIVHRNLTLVRTSLETGYVHTALRAVGTGFRDAYSFAPEDIALHAALFFVAVNIVLGTSYVVRIGTLAGATRPIGMGLGAAFIFFLGLGCLSCGAVLGIVLSSIFGATLLQTLLLWGGTVMLWAGIAALGILALVLGKKVTDPFVC